MKDQVDVKAGLKFKVVKDIASRDIGGLSGVVEVLFVEGDRYVQLRDESGKRTNTGADWITMAKRWGWIELIKKADHLAWIDPKSLVQRTREENEFYSRPENQQRLVKDVRAEYAQISEITSKAHATAEQFARETDRPLDSAWIAYAFEIDSANRNWSDGAFTIYDVALRDRVVRLRTDPENIPPSLATRFIEATDEHADHLYSEHERIDNERDPYVERDDDPVNAVPNACLEAMVCAIAKALWIDVDALPVEHIERAKRAAQPIAQRYARLIS